MTRQLLGVAMISVASVLAGGAHAADISWGPATDITGDSDVSLVGSLVAAANPGPGLLDTSFPLVTSTTVNGVTFDAFPRTGNPTTHGIFTIAETPGDLFGKEHGENQAPFADLSPVYQALLDPVISTSSNRTFTVTAASLNFGQEYLFQVWINRSGIETVNDTMTITGGPAQHAVVLDENNINVRGGIGQFAIATFTADSASQTFTFDHSGGFPYVNAFQLRAVPEPGTLTLMLLAAAGLLARRRVLR